MRTSRPTWHGDSMASDQRRDKWQQRYLDPDTTRPQPAGVLVDNAFLLPRAGRALDLACGRGGNALFLARHGLTTEGWDFAPAAIETLDRLAADEQLSLTGVVRDVERQPPEPDSFDVIVVSYFLVRELVPLLIAALRPGGLVFYETFVRDTGDDPAPGPRNPAFRLATNELRHLFNELQLVSYQEHGRIGKTDAGVRNTARLIGFKPEQSGVTAKHPGAA